MISSSIFIGFSLIFVLTFAATDASYSVHWIEGNFEIEKSVQTTVEPLSIYCYKGKPKYFIYIWQSVLLYINIKTDNFNQYIGHAPEDVWNAYKEDNKFWSYTFFTSSKSRYMYLNPFNQTCFAINTQQNYGLLIQVRNIDYLRISFLIGGIALFFWAKKLGENHVFYYMVGICIGIGFSFMVLVYIFSKMIPGKPIMYGTMVGGWAVGLYFFQHLWSNFQSLLISYRTYFLWYMFIVGFISFVFIYKRGPPKDQRSKNIITWTLQIIGFIAIYFSSDVTEAIITICVVLILMKYLSFGWLKALRFYWVRRYPPKRVLLTEEQYYEEGIKETAKALEELRGYCSSPECKQWDLVRKLNNPSRFARFMEEAEHLNRDEIDEYDSSSFNIYKSKAKNSTSITSTIEDYLTSDDSSFSPDET